jgi:hypothetical protein
MDNSNGCKRWVKQNVQNLTFMDNLLAWPGFDQRRRYVFACAASLSTQTAGEAYQISVGEFQQIATYEHRHMWRNRRRSGADTTERALDALKSNCEDKVLQNDGASSGVCRVIDARCLSDAPPWSMWRSPEATAPNMIESAGALGTYWICWHQSVVRI